MNIGSIIDDEKIKMKNSHICSYCGSTKNLSIDHLIPKFYGGIENSDNFVLACRKCNSSKGISDLMEWYSKNNSFPLLLLLRRYLKLIIQYCQENNIMNISIKEAESIKLPFNLNSIPQNSPQPKELKLWIEES